MDTPALNQLVLLPLIQTINKLTEECVKFLEMGTLSLGRDYIFKQSKAKYKLFGIYYPI